MMSIALAAKRLKAAKAKKRKRRRKPVLRCDACGARLKTVEKCESCGATDVAEGDF